MGDIRAIEIDMDELVNKSINIIRNAMAQFKNPAVLWSTGKDSTTVLKLIQMAMPDGKIPIPVVHIDTGYKFPEIYEYRDRIAKEWGFNLLVIKNEEAIKAKTSPDTVGHFNCCTALKTNALKMALQKYKWDALILSIRRDEHYIRNMERVFSPRDKEFNWHLMREKSKEEMKEGDAPIVSEQQVELWDLWQTDFGPNCSHVRVHPILHWTEYDVWRFIKKYNIPFNPLYRADYVKKRFGWNHKRFRSLGCKPCTVPVDSNASTIDEILQELKTTDVEERSGRSQDKEQEQVMRRLRALGYM